MEQSGRVKWGSWPASIGAPPLRPLRPRVTALRTEHREHSSRSAWPQRGNGARGECSTQSASPDGSMVVPAAALHPLWWVVAIGPG